VNFNSAAATALFSALQSYAQQLGLFQNVDTHEPANAPGNRLYASIVLASIRSDPDKSGMASVSGTITFTVRIWSAALQRPLDSIDPEVLAAASAYMGALAGGFTLGETIRNIDLFAMSAQAVWTEFQDKQFRVIEIAVPAVINDLWTEAE
jgi:hypothetical protein